MTVDYEASWDRLHSVSQIAKSKERYESLHLTYPGKKIPGWSLDEN